LFGPTEHTFEHWELLPYISRPIVAGREG
jgi:hypothetical protein